MNRRGNKANRSKDSILADAKELLKVYMPIYQRMPKIERIDGCPKEFKKATIDIIRHYSMAHGCPDRRDEFIPLMFGDYGVLAATIELISFQGLMTDSEAFRVCDRLYRIREGVVKWQRSLRASGSAEGQREETGTVLYPPQEPVGSM